MPRKTEKKRYRFPRKKPPSKIGLGSAAERHYKNEKPTNQKAFVGVFLKICKVIPDVAVIIKAIKSLFF